MASWIYMWKVIYETACKSLNWVYQTQFDSLYQASGIMLESLGIFCWQKNCISSINFCYLLIHPLLLLPPAFWERLTTSDTVLLKNENCQTGANGLEAQPTNVSGLTLKFVFTWEPCNLYFWPYEKNACYRKLNEKERAGKKEKTKV